MLSLVLCWSLGVVVGGASWLCAGFGSMPSVSLCRHLILDNRVVSSRGFPETTNKHGRDSRVTQITQVALRQLRRRGAGVCGQEQAGEITRAQIVAAAVRDVFEPSV